MQLLLFLLTLMGQSAFITSVLYEYHYISDKMSWKDAQSYCKSNYTDLATVSNMADFNRISEFPQNEAAWIGLYRKENANKVWHWSLPGVEFNDSDTKWSSGKGPVYYCGFLFADFEWGDNNCGNNQMFLCYDENNSTKFHLITVETSWLEAQKYCREKHTDLVSGLKQLQDVEPMGLVNLAKAAGLIPSVGQGLVWFGLFADRWTWSDGNSSSFRNWESLPAGIDRKCAVMEINSKWKTYDCAELKPFICYNVSGVGVTTTASPESQTSTAPPTTEAQKTCTGPNKGKLKLITDKLNWEEALYYCRGNGGNLATITNQEDQICVQEAAKQAQTPFVWTGLRFTCTLNFWFWVSNNGVTYENWAASETWNDCDQSGAMETEGGHKWFKRNDMEEMNFICSIN